MPKTNVEYWEPKLKRNVERDREVDEYYRKLGWNIKRIWEHEVKHDIEKVVDDIKVMIDRYKN